MVGHVRPFILLIIFLTLTSPVLAADIKFYEISSEINTDGTSSNRISFLLSSEADELDFVIFANVINFRYEANFKGLKCSTSRDVIGTVVSCTGIENNVDDRVVKFTYDTVSYTQIQNKKGIFNANYKLLNDADSASIAIKLPEGFVLTNDTTVPSYSPRDGVITSDGRRIIIQWFRNGIGAEHDLPFSVVYEDRRPEPIADLSRVVVSSFVLVVIFGIVMYFVMHGRNKERTETILEVLTQDEKSVINIVKQNGGRVIQKRIVDVTDYSKAKVSRILRDLQSRGIITMEPNGRENIVHLTKKMKK